MRSECAAVTFAGEIFQQDFGSKTGVLFMRRLERADQLVAGKQRERALLAERFEFSPSDSQSRRAADQMPRCMLLKPTLFKGNQIELIRACEQAIKLRSDPPDRQSGPPASRLRSISHTKALVDRSAFPVRYCQCKPDAAHKPSPPRKSRKPLRQLVAERGMGADFAQRFRSITHQVRYMRQ